MHLQHSRNTRVRGGRRPGLFLIVVLLPFAVGCNDSSSGTAAEGRRLKTVDVPPALEVHTIDDPQARERVPVLVGVLPADFPADLPLYIPASLIDFGRTDQGSRSVSLLTPHKSAQVRSRLDALLRERGWTVTAEGDGRFTLLRNGQRRVRLVVEDAHPGTLYRFEY
ncbi:MAG: hypothetical protein GY856_28635 [bacterium]|nr:hypothetical protein [bacterium]